MANNDDDDDDDDGDDDDDDVGDKERKEFQHTTVITLECIRRYTYLNTFRFYTALFKPNPYKYQTLQ